MTGTSYRSRLLVWAVVLHLAHVPVPVCDGDDETHAAGRPARALWDVDLLLLGADPPDDTDSGPLDETPENLDGTAFGSPYGLSRPLLVSTADRTEGRGPVPHQAASPLALWPGVPADPGVTPRGFAASYLSASAWRQLLCVSRT